MQWCTSLQRRNVMCRVRSETLKPRVDVAKRSAASTSFAFSTTCDSRIGRLREAGSAATGSSTTKRETSPSGPRTSRGAPISSRLPQKVIARIAGSPASRPTSHGNASVPRKRICDECADTSASPQTSVKKRAVASTSATLSSMLCSFTVRDSLFPSDTQEHLYSKEGDCRHISYQYQGHQVQEEEWNDAPINHFELQA